MGSEVGEDITQDEGVAATAETTRLLLLTKDHRVSTDYGRRGRKRGRKNGILLQQLKRNQPSNSVQPERQR